MKNKASLKETKVSKDCGCECHAHSHCGKPIVIGLVLLVVGMMLEYGYTFAQVLMLIGGIMVVKGVLLMAMRKDK